MKLLPVHAQTIRNLLSKVAALPHDAEHQFLHQQAESVATIMDLVAAAEEAAATPPPPIEINRIDVDQYYDAFRTRTSGIARDCVCGKTWYYPSERGLFEEGELEQYEADPDAHIAQHSPGGVIVQGVEYCDACDCWEPKAQRIVNFLREHQREIGAFFRLEKEALLRSSQAVPEIPV